MRRPRLETRRAIRTPSPRLDAECFLGMVRGQFHERVLLGVASPRAGRRRRQVAMHAVRIFAVYLGDRALVPGGRAE